MPLDNSLIELEGVVFRYPTSNSPVLDGLSFEIQAGQFTGLIGPTGSGKSTLVQLLNGLLPPDAGRLRFLGRVVGVDISGHELRTKVGVVFQFPEKQLFEQSVFDDVAFAPRNLGCDGEALLQRVDNALEIVGLDPDEFAGRNPFLLSGGEKRRVAIAGVIAMEPELLVLDEPTSGLDASGRKELLEMLVSLNARGTTVLLVTHDMDEIASLADRIIVVNSGRIAACGTPAEVFSNRILMEELGLGLPEAAEIVQRLRSRGFDVAYALDFGELREALLSTAGVERP